VRTTQTQHVWDRIVVLFGFGEYTWLAPAPEARVGGRSVLLIPARVGGAGPTRSRRTTSSSAGHGASGRRGTRPSVSMSGASWSRFDSNPAAARWVSWRIWRTRRTRGRRSFFSSCPTVYAARVRPRRR
jgi:hypothetical protein